MILNEAGNFVRSRGQTRQIERNAAEQGARIGFRREAKIRFCQPFDDKRVDGIGAVAGTGGR